MVDTDPSGEVVTTLNGAGRAGVNEVTWRLDSTSQNDTPPGRYTARLAIGEEEQSRSFEVAYPWQTRS